MTRESTAERSPLAWEGDPCHVNNWVTDGAERDIVERINNNISFKHSNGIPNKGLVNTGCSKCPMFPLLYLQSSNPADKIYPRLFIAPSWLLVA